jgi:hypothetical protein
MTACLRRSPVLRAKNQARCFAHGVGSYGVAASCFRRRPVLRANPFGHRRFAHGVGSYGVAASCFRRRPVLRANPFGHRCFAHGVGSYGVAASCFRRSPVLRAKNQAPLLRPRSGLLRGGSIVCSGRTVRRCFAQAPCPQGEPFGHRCFAHGVGSYGVAASCFRRRPVLRANPFGHRCFAHGVGSYGVAASCFVGVGRTARCPQGEPLSSGRTRSGIAASPTEWAPTGWQRHAFVGALSTGRTRSGIAASPTEWAPTGVLAARGGRTRACPDLVSLYPSACGSRGFASPVVSRRVFASRRLSSWSFSLMRISRPRSTGR